MFEKWNVDRKSVNSSWDTYFRNVIRGIESNEAFVNPLNLKPELGEQL